MHEPLAAHRFATAANMTDRVAALQLLCHGTGETRERALAAFHAAWRHDRLVTDKWFAVQAMARREAVTEDVRDLTAHPDFSLANPNRARSLLASLAYANPVHFHAASGDGHRLLAEHVLKLDRTNPQLAARLVSPLGRWARFVEPQAASMRAELERIREAGVAVAGRSRDRHAEPRRGLNEGGSGAGRGLGEMPETCPASGIAVVLMRRRCYRYHVTANVNKVHGNPPRAVPRRGAC